MRKHTNKAFDANLHDLKSKIARMGGYVEKQSADAIDALARSNAALAREVITFDEAVDQLQRDIEAAAVVTIARRQPMAIDLREIVAALRISTDLERVGDLSKNIAKRVIALDGEALPVSLIRGVEHMGEMMLAQLKRVLDSYARHDVAAALAVWRDDEKIDAITQSLFAELLNTMLEDPRNIRFCIHLLFCAKNIERKGDHATNIAETVHYVVEGRTIPAARPKRNTTSLLLSMSPA